MDQVVPSDEIQSEFTPDQINGVLISNWSIAFPFIGGYLGIFEDMPCEIVR
jgi:hypothetical protein